MAKTTMAQRASFLLTSMCLAAKNVMKSHKTSQLNLLMGSVSQSIPGQAYRATMERHFDVAEQPNGFPVEKRPGTLQQVTGVHVTAFAGIEFRRVGDQLVRIKRQPGNRSQVSSVSSSFVRDNMVKPALALGSEQVPSLQSNSIRIDSQYGHAGASFVESKYGPGFEGWDYYKAGYITSFVISGMCALCQMMLIGKGISGKAFWHYTMQFHLFALFMTASYIFQGVAMRVLEIYHDRGETMGRKWSENNNGWMGFWLAGMATYPLADACYIAFALTFSSTLQLDFPYKFGYIVFSVGVAVVVFEVVVLILEKIDWSGKIMMYVKLSKCIVAMLIFSRAYGHFSQIHAILGAFSELIGIIILVSAPDSCKQDHPNRAGCFYPKSYNHTAICHTFIAISIVFTSHAVVRKYRDHLHNDSAPLRDMEHPVWSERTGNPEDILVRQ